MITKGTLQKVEQLRAAYDRIETVDPDGFAYKCLCNWLDMQTTEVLEFLVEAKVKFVSGLARNRVNRRALEAEMLVSAAKAHMRNQCAVEGAV